MHTPVLVQASSLHIQTYNWRAANLKYKSMHPEGAEAQSPKSYTELRKH